MENLKKFLAIAKKEQEKKLSLFEILQRELDYLSSLRKRELISWMIEEFLTKVQKEYKLVVYSFESPIYYPEYDERTDSGRCKAFHSIQLENKNIVFQTRVEVFNGCSYLNTFDEYPNKDLEEAKDWFKEKINILKKLKLGNRPEYKSHLDFNMLGEYKQYEEITLNKDKRINKFFESILEQDNMNYIKFHYKDVLGEISFSLIDYENVVYYYIFELDKKSMCLSIKDEGKNKVLLKELDESDINQIIEVYQFRLSCLENH